MLDSCCNLEMKEHFQEAFTPEVLEEIRKQFNIPEQLNVRYNTYAEGIRVDLDFETLRTYGNGTGTYKARETMGSFFLEPLPGNGHVLVSCHSWIHETYRGKGLGSRLHKMRLDAAKAAGANAMMCTVRADNEAELALMRKFGWEQTWEYVATWVEGGSQREADHKVQVWLKRL